MARPDWGSIQSQFLADHAKSNISPKEWCEAQGLNYSTAKRYIKIANAQKTAKDKSANAQRRRSASQLANNEEFSEKEKRFIAEYQKDGNATQAAIRANYSPDTAGQIGHQLLKKTSIAKEIAHQQKASIERTLGSADYVLEQMWQLATFDANEISQYRRGCCRRCWGLGHKYQWTEDEYLEACEKAEMRDKPMPDDSGGTDYMKTREPNPDCPHCGGEGIGRVYMQDTRTLSGVARLAYSGAKIGKGSIELVTIDRQRMLEAVAKRLGLMDSNAALRLQQLEIERRELELAKLRDEVNKPDRPEGVEEDYQLQALTPDENIPGKPIL